MEGPWPIDEDIKRLCPVTITMTYSMSSNRKGCFDLGANKHFPLPSPAPGAECRKRRMIGSIGGEV